MIDLTAGLAVRPDGTINPDLIDAAVRPHLSRDIEDLADALQDPANTALAECDQAGHTVIVLETFRPDDVERAYWRKGRRADGTVVHPDEVVTQAMDGAHSWHSYQLAFDLSGVNSSVIATFVRHGFASGSAWKHHPDYPHFQWGKCPPSPTAQDIADYRNGNIGNVWLRYDAGAA